MNKFLILLLLVSQSAFAFDFKGIEIGSKVEVEAVEKTLSTECHDGSTGWDVVCIGKTTIIGNDADIFVTLDRDHVVQSISLTFAPNNFDEISKALIKKYGKTKTNKSKLSNAMGANFQQVDMLWKSNSGVMSLIKYKGNISKSGLTIVSFEELVRRTKQLEKDKSDI